MYPTIFTDDIVEVRPIFDSNKLKMKESIVLARKDGKYILHRLAYVSSGVITKGDNLILNDGEVDKIIGVIESRKLTLSSLLKRANYSAFKLKNSIYDFWSRGIALKFFDQNKESVSHS